MPDGGSAPGRKRPAGSSRGRSLTASRAHRSTRWSRVAWGIAALDIVAFLVASTYDAASFDAGATALYVIGIASFAGVGALLYARVPGNSIGILLLAAGTTLVAAVMVGMYADLGARQVPPWPGSGIARSIGDSMFIYPFVIAIIGVPLVFPDGRLPSRRFRWLVALAVADMVAWTVLAVVFPGGSAARVPGLAFLLPLVSAVETFILIATVVSFAAAVYAVWLRFRRGDRVQRQQVKWLVAVVSLAAIILPISMLLTDTNPVLADALSSVAILLMFALPIVIAIAILRYHLYEIDRIISRTIGWALTTGLIVAVFAGVVVGLQAVLAEVIGGSTLAVAGSTLLVAALFQPLRRRIQRAVDQRFNRAGYDAQRVARDFSERLREVVDLEALSEEVRRAAGETVRPETSVVWLRIVPDRRPTGRS